MLDLLKGTGVVALSFLSICFCRLITGFLCLTGRQVDFTDCSQLPLNITFDDSTVFERVPGTVYRC